MMWDSELNNYVLSIDGHDDHQSGWGGWQRLNRESHKRSETITNGDSVNRSIKFINTSGEAVRIYWLKCKVSGAEYARANPSWCFSQDEQIANNSVKVGPFNHVSYQCGVSHRFLIQYGTEHFTDTFARSIITSPQYRATYKYIRIPFGIKSGSAFDVATGITIDPETWAERRDKFSHPASPHLPMAQEFLRISMEARGIRSEGTRIRWDQMGFKSTTWKCPTCTMPNNCVRCFCWACNGDLRYCPESEDEDPLGNEAIQRDIDDSFSHATDFP